MLLWPNWMLHSKPFNSGKRQVHHLWSQYTQFWVIWDMYWKNTQCLSCWTFFINILAPPTITLTIYQKILVQQWQLRWQNGVMATTALHLAVNSYNWKDGDNDYEESYNCESVTACVNQSCGDNKCRESLFYNCMILHSHYPHLASYNYLQPNEELLWPWHHSVISIAIAVPDSFDK